MTNSPGNAGHHNFAEMNNETGEFVDTVLRSRLGGHNNANDPTMTLIRFGARKNQLIHKNVIEIVKDILERKELVCPSPSRLLISKDIQKRRRSQAVTGTIRNLVIPFQFTDEVGLGVTLRTELDTLFNGPAPSVNNFFDENSINSVNIASSVVDWITLDNAQLSEKNCAGIVQNDDTKRNRTQI